MTSTNSNARLKSLFNHLNSLGVLDQNVITGICQYCTTVIQSRQVIVSREMTSLRSTGLHWPKFYCESFLPGKVVTKWTPRPIFAQITLRSPFFVPIFDPSFPFRINLNHLKWNSWQITRPSLTALSMLHINYRWFLSLTINLFQLKSSSLRSAASQIIWPK